VGEEGEKRLEKKSSYPCQEPNGHKKRKKKRIWGKKEKRGKERKKKVRRYPCEIFHKCLGPGKRKGGESEGKGEEAGPCFIASHPGRRKVGKKKNRVKEKKNCGNLQHRGRKNGFKGEKKRETQGKGGKRNSQPVIYQRLPI